MENKPCEKCNQVIQLEDRIKLLEDNAFSDRATIIELENKLLALNEEIKISLMPVNHITKKHTEIMIRIKMLEAEVFPDAD